MTKIKLTANGIEREFTLSHAQAILIHQIKNRCKSCWSIVGSDYEFNGVEINGVNKSKKSPKGKAESVANSTGEDTAK